MIAQSDALLPGLGNSIRAAGVAAHGLAPGGAYPYQGVVFEGGGPLPAPLPNLEASSSDDEDAAEPPPEVAAAQALDEEAPPDGGAGGADAESEDAQPGAELELSTMYLCNAHPWISADTRLEGAPPRVSQHGDPQPCDPCAICYAMALRVSGDCAPRTAARAPGLLGTAKTDAAAAKRLDAVDPLARARIRRSARTLASFTHHVWVHLLLPVVFSYRAIPFPKPPFDYSKLPKRSAQSLIKVNQVRNSGTNQISLMCCLLTDLYVLCM